MSKRDIFSKINLKDYNNILENILEQKAFTEDVKNLLLSMFYKIEYAYQDYKTIKVNVNSKNFFLQTIAKIIKNECKEIILIKPLSEESLILEKENVNYKVDRENGKITCYPNERIILEALVTLNQKEIELKEEYKLYQKPLTKILYKGNLMNVTEVIRDFNGWSWDITESQIENKNINLVYQNLLILLGRDFLQNWITEDNKEKLEDMQIPNNEILRSKYNNSFGLTNEEVQEIKEIDYLKLMKETLEDKYGKESSKKFLNQFEKVILAIGYNMDENQKQQILKQQTIIQEKLNKMRNNRKFLEELSKEKKKIAKQIKEIDKILSEEKLLKEEYELRNSKLPNKKKIFSVSHLRIMLNKERENKLDRIKEYNKLMEPNEFLKIKTYLEEKNKFYEDLELKENSRANEEKQINRLQIYFLECFNNKINKSSKTEIKNLIYELRYYEHIPYQDTEIYNLNVEKIQEKIKEVEQNIIEIACKEKVMVTITKQNELNKTILANQFKSKIINIENINYVLKYHKGILEINIYDGNTEEEKKQLQIKQKTELEVKLNRKIKIWE